MAGEIKIIDIETIKDKFLGKTIVQLENKPVEIVGASVKSPSNLKIGTVGLTFGASAKFAINAYNDAQDNDDEQVVGVPGVKTPTGVLDPKIPFDTQKAWLRYSFVGGLTAEAKAKLQAVNVGVDARAEMVFSDYRMHAPGDDALTRIASDLPSLRTALDVNDVLAMNPGEALYYQVRGELAFSVKVSFADVFTKTLSEIASALPSSETFAIQIDVGAFASFQIKTTDDFVLVFWRDRAAGQFHAGVRKASTRGGSGALGVSVTAKFARPDEITKLAMTFFEGAFGAPLAKVTAILDAAAGGNLDETQKKVFDRVVQLLGIEDAVDQIAAARDRLNDLPGQLEAKIEEVVTTQIGLSWKYEYSRVESTQNIVEAALTRDQLTQLHPSLVAQQVQPLLDRAKTSDTDTDPAHDITLTKYLDEKTIVRTGGFGFSLGIGKWFQIGASDKNKLTIRQRRSLDQKQSMISYIGAREFSETLGKITDKFAFDFAASMDNWAEKPTAADFDFSLALAVSDQDRKLDKNDVARIIDTASLWSIITSDDVSTVAEALKGSIGKRTTARYELKFPEEVLRQQVAAMAGNRNDGQMAMALAAAMPWREEFSRASWRRRLGLYTRAWQLRLQDDRTSGDEAVRAIERDLRDQGMLLIDRSPVGDSLRQQIELNPEVVPHYTGWVTGMALLAEAVGAGTMQHSKIETIFSLLHSYFTRKLYVRAIGRRLTDLAAANGMLGKVGRALVVTETGADGTAKKIVNIAGRA